MPPIEKHADISKEITRETHQQVHEGIDDPQHKGKRHDITRVLEFNHLVGDVQVLVGKTLAYFGAKKK